MKPKISIIVPIYNSENNIKKCLDSILEQSYDNLQIICVDDGSEDNSRNIIQDYAEKDTRVCVVRQKNGGVSNARNTALRYVSGDYILFVDSDDWIEQETCKIAVECAIHFKADVVMWSYVREIGNESRRKVIYDKDCIFEKKEILSKLHRRMVGVIGDELSRPENADALCTVWGKLYKKELITNNNIVFYDIRKTGTYEDGLFNLEILYYANKVVFLNQYLYHYRRNRNDSLTSSYNPNMREQWKHLFNIIEKYIERMNLGSEYMEALNNRIALSLIALGINEYESVASLGIKLANIKNIIIQEKYGNAIKQLDISRMPMHWKIFFWCAKNKNVVGVYILIAIIQKIRGR